MTAFFYGRRYAQYCENAENRKMHSAFQGTSVLRGNIWYKLYTRIYYFHYKNLLTGSVIKKIIIILNDLKLKSFIFYIFALCKVNSFNLPFLSTPFPNHLFIYIYYAVVFQKWIHLFLQRIFPYLQCHCILISHRQRKLLLTIFWKKLVLNVSSKIYNC